MNKIKDIEMSKIDNVMSAVGSVLKAIVTVAACLDSFKSTIAVPPTK